ncbi:ABC transporter F family member 3 [Selaginella moellendorffii]|uniref:ABC transporter F family member 3 n=1 Tax=Selaginella moellendorffii TaxID=88036 RepID=UPI000D1C6C09|nr:ABC transporter F family member 3 [Selaginella moellendorffii]|eukprot:XP_024537100.1 ABC transporter F family member 3 [Selaginella moellendorffii]
MGIDGSVKGEVLALIGRRIRDADVDSIIVDYIINVLQDDTFDFGKSGENAYEALGPLLVEAECVADDAEARWVCKKLAEKFYRGSIDENKLSVRSLAAPVRMSEGLRSSEAAGTAHHEDLLPQISERDQAKLERRRKKEERQRRADYEAHVAAADAAAAGMAGLYVTHNTDGDASVPKDIRMENFSISMGGRELINSASVTLAYGRRYGLVGRNGTGKTTLLKHMAMHAIDGLPKNCQILHVEQEVVGSSTTVLQCVLSTDIERTQLLEEEASLVDAKKSANDTSSSKDAASERLAQIYKRLEQIDAYTAESRAASILAGLSFTSDMQVRETKTFSGGWRMRIALARALFIQPDLLLLDEPTNHLDLHAVLWLETYLLKWPKTLIVVSHARNFLNAVVTDILHLHGQKLVTYKGDYDTFERTRAERLSNQQKAHESNERTRAHIQAFVDKFRYNAKRASLVQSRIKALDRIGYVDAVVNDPDYKFEFPTPDDRPSGSIISFSDASFGYPGGPVLFRNLNFGLDLDSRLAVVGANGIGKSTLLKLISGELEPVSGTVFRSPKVRMAVFSQHHVDGLDLSSTPLLYMSRCFPGAPEQKIRAHLGSFGLSGNLALQAMYTLSGGQKSRVAFAKITFNKPHILLLDEPSNHLDLDAVEALIQGLALFQGGVLMVSHDEHLISGSVDELWVVTEGKVSPFHGSFQDYKRTLRVA